MHLSLEDLRNLDKHYRIRFFNMLSGARTPFLLGSTNKSSVNNLAIFNSIVHIGANPPLLGFLMRPLSVERHSYQNIIDSGYYTLNSIPLDMIGAAHKTAGKFPAEVSEFDACGIEPELIDNFPAPFVKYAPVKLAMKFEEELLVKSNNTRLIVGAVQDIYIDASYVETDGHLKLDTMNNALIAGLETYYSIVQEKRIKYSE